MLEMNFPFRIDPEVITGNAMWSREAYESILEQLAKGVSVYDNIDGVGVIIGISRGCTGERIVIEIYDDFAPVIGAIDANDMFMATPIDSDADPNEDGVMVVHTARVQFLALLRKSSAANVIADKRFDVVAKEKTLSLEKPEEIVTCVLGCNGQKDACIPVIVKKCEEGKRVFMLFGAHVMEKLREIGGFKFTVKYQKNAYNKYPIPVGMWIEKEDGK